MSRLYFLIQPMDHFVLTLILAAIELLIVPWVAWATVRIFELASKQAVIESQMKQEVDRQKDHNKSMQVSFDKLEKELNETRKEIHEGFKEIIDKLGRD